MHSAPHYSPHLGPGPPPPPSSPVVAASVHRVAQVVRAFGGDLGGDFLRTGVLLADAGRVTTVEARVPREAVAFLTSVLCIDCHVRQVPPAQSCPAADRTALLLTAPALTAALALQPPQTQAGSSVLLHLHTGARLDWRVRWAMFDVDLLTVDSDRLGLRMTTPALRALTVDRLGHVIGRVHEARFCLLDGPARPGVAAAAAMRVAAAMVADPRREWAMDDTLGGPQAWVAARWSRLVGAPQTVRPSRPPHAPPLARDASCALCQEPFAPQDVVINLPCNHNFHAACPTLQGGQGGLCVWLDGHGTCPSCRAATTTST